MGVSEKSVGEVISNEDYHKLDSVSKSRLWTFMDDPRLYFHQYLSGNYVRVGKKCFDMGTAVHNLLLDEDSSDLVVIPDNVLSKSGSKAGNAWKEFEKENAGKILLKPKEYADIELCCYEAKRSPKSKGFFSKDRPFVVERAFKAELYGLPCRCKVDKLFYEDGVVMDLKTTERESTKASTFAREAANFGYHIQEKFYRLVLEANNIDVRKWVFVYVSVVPPYTVDVYDLSEEFLQLAGDEIVYHMERLKEAIETGEFGFGSDKIVTVSPPGYLKHKGDYYHE